MYARVTPPPADTLLGDPLGLAEFQFRTAQELCGTCRDYHALWPYRRLAGLAQGVEHCAFYVEPVIRELARTDTAILIPGAADAGTLAQVARATTGLGASITVADRCLTPLAVCRHYADSIAQPLSVLAMDFDTTPFPGRYDVILLHCFLQFMAQERRVAFLRSLRACLSDSGTLIAVERRIVHDGVRRLDYASRLIEALAAGAVPLPEGRAAFQTRTARMMETRDRRLETFSAEGFRSALGEAGFSVKQWLGTAAGQPATLTDGELCFYQIAVVEAA